MPRTKQQLQEVDPYEFEDLVADVLDHEGWDTEVTQGQADGGIDVIARRGGTVDTKLVVQAKRYSEGNKVGSREVREYAGVRQREVDADSMAIFTSGEFTSGAEDEAEQLNIKLVDGDELASRIKTAGLEDLVDEYIDAESTSPAEPSVDDSESTVWFGGVVLALFAQVGGLLLALDPSLLGVVVPPVISGSFLTLGLFGGPIMVAADAIGLHRNGAAYQPNRVVWPLLTLIFGPFGVAAYLYVRIKKFDG